MFFLSLGSLDTADSLDKSKKTVALSFILQTWKWTNEKTFETPTLDKFHEHFEKRLRSRPCNFSNKVILSTGERTSFPRV